MVQTRSVTAAARSAPPEVRFVPARLSWDVMICYVLLGISTAVSAQVEVPVFAQMAISTLLLLYIGAHLALHAKHHSDDEPEVLESKDAKWFPIMGGGMLVSLYLVFKFLPKKYVDIVVGFYFFIVGQFGLSSTIKVFLFMALPHALYDALDAKSVSFKVPMFLARFLFESEEKEDGSPGEIDNEVKITGMDIPCHALSAVASYFYLTTKHWISNNLFGMAFSVQGISLLNLDTFLTGAILLVGLFIYDIFFVFATDVMVTVATKFEAPIKLLFPRGANRPSLLGLGDIVIPGIFVSLMLRFDHTLYCHTESFKKPYFWSCMTGYFAGLSMTLYVMYAFEHAQPALLYLVPTCLISVLLCALVRGEFKKLVSFRDHPVDSHAHAD